VKGVVMTKMFWIWMAVGLMAIIIEVVTPTLVIISFAVGAASAAIYGQFYPTEYVIQTGIFLVVSLVLLPFIRKLASKFTKDSPETSNVDRMIGETAIVTKAIDPNRGGHVRFEGEIWAADAPVAVPENSKVTILSITGTRVKVEPLS
jgi:membrane protein implicated in regulation of membrane protease activity